ncbi:hypothetical protein K502DRAFT_322766 [Neoconidiobolus thromboides FSU 785]|nr:hypothetical protein K502DRAFT_322766 [Neoconidiobolus thromboides FSU 785]
MLVGNFEVDITLSPSTNNIDLIGGSQTYSQFLEYGSVFLGKVMDPYKLWLDKLDLKAILTKKEPSILSYTLILLLAHFTLPRDSVAYNQIYRKALQGIKATLSQSYSNPCYNHVVALRLLSLVNFFHSNFSLARRYISDAVRMAQCLGYDINDSSFDAYGVTDIRYNELSRGRKVWKMLYFTYLILSFYISDMPFVRFEVKDPLHFFRENQSIYNNREKTDYKVANEDSYKHIKNFIEVVLKIFTHVQKVKENYNISSDCSIIPSNELLLPRSEFISCSTILTSLIQHLKLVKDECEYTKEEIEIKINDHEFNFLRYLKVLIQYTAIVLYYPSVMVYPQPINFTKPKLKLLFKHANQIITYYLNSNLSENSDCKISTKVYQFGSKDGFDSVIDMPFHYQAYHSFFVLINLLHQTSILQYEDIIMINESKTKCVMLVKELYRISKSNNTHSKDCANRLNQIKQCLPRFQLSINLIQKISIYLN